MPRHLRKTAAHEPVRQRRAGPAGAAAHQAAAPADQPQPRRAPFRQGRQQHGIQRLPRLRPRRRRALRRLEHLRAAEPPVPEALPDGGGDARAAADRRQRVDGLRGQAAAGAAVGGGVRADGADGRRAGERLRVQRPRGRARALRADQRTGQPLEPAALHRAHRERRRRAGRGRHRDLPEVPLRARRGGGRLGLPDLRRRRPRVQPALQLRHGDIRPCRCSRPPRWTRT